MEDWIPSTVEELLSSLQGEGLVLNDAQTSSLPAGLQPYDYFPSEESTKFGDWVKAGALKAGDQLSIHDGVDEVSGDKTVTVISNTRDNTPTRVYNLEIESRPGEITHNYFVGSDGVLVHNINDGGVTIGSAMGDHGPPHLDVCGCGPKVRIGQNGKPLRGEPELSPQQKRICKKHKKWIRKKVKEIMRGFRNR